MFKFQPLILALSTMVLSISCGTPQPRDRSLPLPTQPINWTSVSYAEIKLSSPQLGLAPVITNITYTSPERGILELDTSGLTFSMPDDDTLSLGNIKVNRLRTNKLRICGANGTTKCNRSAIRVYTTDGFKHDETLNTLPVTMDNLLVGTGEANATVLDTYVISPTDWVVKKNDHTNIDYDLDIDMSNGGYGSYSMSLIIEVVLGYE